MTVDEKSIKEKIINNDGNYNKDIINYINSGTTTWLEPEGFPKGRRNPGERDIACGTREFVEETGYSNEDFEVIENILPYEEILLVLMIKYINKNTI